ncbi:hypothetical protein HPP92_009776 [Vanilla planifolia]|uniref:Transcription repressor n=1 Tax=Vanilla planifolia TaxID=51239 RepID=A0A835RGV1_VANPL|nr:hypothetical protein HPP92_009776 [Vanilla planifolia]
MVRKLGVPSFFFKAREVSRSPSSSWLWPSCRHPRTLSFRHPGDDVYKTVNSIYFDTTESCFTDETESFSTTSASDTETVVRGLRSDRLFFEPGDAASSSIMEAAKPCCGCPFKGSVALAMESEDPFKDFRVSMEEMVAAHGIMDWRGLQELLVWYLRANGKKTHGFIFGAFVDLLVDLSSSSPFSSSSLQ